MSRLTILSWNADGLRGKRCELMDLVSDLSINLLAICETRLTSNIKLNFPGFVCYRADKHPSGRGQGVALLVKSNLQHSRIKVPVTQHMEVVGIELIMSNRKYLIISVYQSPNLKLIPKDLDLLFDLGDHVLIMGDFNARHSHWFGHAHNTNGKLLFNHMIDNDFTIHAPSDATLVHYNDRSTPSLPDLVLSRNIFDVSNMRVIPSLSSNHHPIYFTLKNQVPNVIASKRYNYASADWSSFKQYLNNNTLLTTQVYTYTQEIDAAIASLQCNIISGRNNFVPLKTVKNHSILPRNIKRLIKHKNKLRKLHLLESSQHLKKELRTQINCLQNHIRERIKVFNDNNLNKKLSMIDQPGSELWRLVGSIRSESREIVPLKRGDGSFTSNTLEQCEELALAFHENMCLTTDWSSDVEVSVANSISTLNSYSFLTPYSLVRPVEISKIIRKLKVRKAPGVDSIDNCLLKNLPYKAIIELTKIFNACLTLGYFPNTWKTAKVIPLRKPGKDPTISTNYRPISLLPTIGKLFEKIIHSRLLKSTEHLIINEQFGFRSNHSTIQQLARVSELVAHNLNLGNHCGMFLLDLEKAFDTVWHHGLLHKIMGLVPMSLVKLIESYLSNRFFKVYIDGLASGPYSIPAGVPQGSILGPYLFLLYLNDIPIQPRTSLACFADDTASIASSPDLDMVMGRLQFSLDLLSEYFLRWKFKLNDAKTEAILFTRKRKLPTRRLRANSHSIPWSTQVKYLGVILDKRLNWSSHITYIRSKGLKALNALNPLLRRKSKLSKSTKLLIYTTLVRPILTYACPVWSSTCNTNYLKLQVVQNKALKLSHSTAFRTNLTTLHTKIKLPLLRNFILNKSKTFYLIKNPRHKNSLISNIGQSRRATLPYIDKYRTFRLPHHYIL